MSSSQPLVTWLMPVKNGMAYLRETLESIANQNYKNHKILVRDDGSTDGTGDELRRWIPYRIPGQIFSGSSLGVGRSLALLVEQADSELCARIDADDVNLPNRLERQVEFLSAHPNVGVVGSYVQTIDESGAKREIWAYDNSDADIRWMTRYATRFCHPTVMFRRSLVLAAGNYRDFVYEDGDLWLRMALLTEMNNMPEILVYYRRSGSSLTGQVKDWLPILRTVAQFNAVNLLPGVSDTSAALELWESSMPKRFKGTTADPPAKMWHLTQLSKSATLLAGQCGKPSDYFTRTACFRKQRDSLKRRLLRRFGLGSLLRLGDFLSVTTMNKTDHQIDSIGCGQQDANLQSIAKQTYKTQK
jgi:hypothetical protein